jgi:hypothetical protein
MIAGLIGSDKLATATIIAVLAHVSFIILTLN